MLLFGRDRAAAALDAPGESTNLGALAANVVARAIARGVYAAKALPLPGAVPSWRDQFGR